MKIKSKANTPCPEFTTDDDAPVTLSGLMTTWCDVEVTTDDGAPVTEIKAIKLSWTEGVDALTATIEVYVSGVDVECDGEIVKVKP